MGPKGEGGVQLPAPGPWEAFSDQPLLKWALLPPDLDGSDRILLGVLCPPPDGPDSASALGRCL